LADTRWNFERSGHSSSYGMICRKINQKIRQFAELTFS
jgi:hypothetical protein